MVDPDAGDRLYRNDNNLFTDVTAASGIISNPLGYGLGVAVSDLNNDGWPDLYVTNDYVEEDYLYINNHDGTFSEKLKEEMGHLSNFSMAAISPISIMMDGPTSSLLICCPKITGGRNCFICPIIMSCITTRCRTVSITSS